MAKTISKIKILFDYQPWLLPVAVPLLLCSSAAEFLFLRGFIDMLNWQETGGQDVVTASAAGQAAAFLALKIGLQILSSVYIVVSVKNLSNHLSIASTRRLLFDGSCESDLIVKNAQSDIFYFAELVKTLLFVAQDLVVLAAVLFVLLQTIELLGSSVFLIALLIFCMVAVVSKEFLVQLGKKRATVLASLVGSLIEFNSSWDTVRMSHKEGYAYNKMKGLFKDLYSIEVVRAFIALLPKNLAEILVLILLVAYISIPNWFDAAALAVLLVAVVRVFPILGRLLSNLQISLFNFSSVENLSKTLALDDPAIRGSFVEELDQWSSIRCENVLASVGERQLFGGITLEILRGEKILLTGANGTGKSTLVKWLMGLKSPVTMHSESKIIIDGTTVSSLADRRRIAYVSQTPIIFSGSLIENITLEFGTVNYDRQARLIVERCRQLADFDFVKAMDEAMLKQHVTSNAPIFSGGEWQLVAIMRALYNGFDFLIIDEGNSALDGQKSQDLVKALCEIDELTLVFVDHRRSTDQCFDRQISL